MHNCIVIMISLCCSCLLVKHLLRSPLLASLSCGTHDDTVDKWGIPYVTLWNTFKKLATKLALSEEEKDAIFRATATNVYTLC